MAFIDEVENLEAKARLRKAVPIAGAGIAVLVLVVALFALSGVFGGGGDFAVTAGEGGAQQVDASVGSSATSTGQDGADSAGSAAGAASSQASSGTAVVVYVTGAVCKPGVYSFDGGARVKDAIDAAGGFSKKADASSLNLARALADGEQIEVLTRAQARKAQTSGETAANASGGAASSRSASGTAASGGAAATGKVNINTATAEELKTLNGVGDVTAQKIIDYRESSGPFAKPEDLKNVSGIGDKRYEAIAASICV